MIDHERRQCEHEIDQLESRLESVRWLLEKACECRDRHPSPLETRRERQFVDRACRIAGGLTEDEMWDAEDAEKQTA